MPLFGPDKTPALGAYVGCCCLHSAPQLSSSPVSLAEHLPGSRVCLQSVWLGAEIDLPEATMVVVVQTAVTDEEAV